MRFGKIVNKIHTSKIYIQPIKPSQLLQLGSSLWNTISKKINNKIVWELESKSGMESLVY